jgi:hypothetical protein
MTARSVAWLGATFLYLDVPRIDARQHSDKNIPYLHTSGTIFLLLTGRIPGINFYFSQFSSITHLVAITQHREKFLYSLKTPSFYLKIKISNTRPYIYENYPNFRCKARHFYI